MNNFPNLRKPEGSLYCGPYCVVACLYSFGILDKVLPAELNRYDPVTKTFDGRSVSVLSNHNLDQLAITIYEITGILTRGVNPKYIEHSGNNSISAMVYILNKFGLKTELIIKDKATYSELYQAFPSEFELMDTMETSVTILNKNSAALPNSILISIIGYPNTTHYVASNEQLEWFDPELDGNTFDWDAIELWDVSAKKRQSAYWLGVSIRVTNPNT
ncbi:hypothetical protein L4D76_12995 [Photobacterium sagamiensis]|uniref:hypothetical protein n=1 Tax=Photobacterium sagamiensis TaxID=2910241 RepID=UPI003D14D311